MNDIVGWSVFIALMCAFVVVYVGATWVLVDCWLFDHGRKR